MCHPRLKVVTRPPLWTGIIELKQPGIVLIYGGFVALLLVDHVGVFIGTAYLYGATLPARPPRPRLDAAARQCSRAWPSWSSRDAASPPCCSPTSRRRALCRDDCRARCARSSKSASSTTAMDMVVIRRRGIVAEHQSTAPAPAPGPRTIEDDPPRPTPGASRTPTSGVAQDARKAADVARAATAPVDGRSTAR